MNNFNEQWVTSGSLPFTNKAVQLFRFQYETNAVYKRFAEAINCHPEKVERLEQIPFLPISFFKQFTVTATAFAPQVIFESSGTTGTQTSRHFVKEVSVYEHSFFTGFEQQYGPVQDYCILGLLPSYLERGSSSLVYMVQKMMEKSGHPLNGFYLYNYEQLAETLKKTEAAGQKVLLIGVTYALLDFASAYPMPLKQVLVLETGGMKGRKKELLRTEVHNLLQQAFHLPQVHSEYGMTELLSQAYAKKNGRFFPPSWMKVCIREEDDPFAVYTTVPKPTTGAINIIDLANIYSCAFIATEDIGRLHPEGSFEVLGRMDNSDIRGCSLLAV